MSEDIETITLWRPVGPGELALIRDLDMRGFPPRLPDQPIFYPVLSEDYAIKIARDWNVPRSGSGFVTKFDVRKDYLGGHAVQEVGGRAHLEYWISAEEMDQFNAAIVGTIRVTKTFP
ncbi:ADP-ribosylation/crystallin J1 [Rhizobium indicum]|uniref:ADP-ribosylation/crystallin J1 n=1 Tax=Rhizobium TaxID=379 RepID=UPI001106A594|nr:MULTISPECIES: ADP-ribosylation/crystallin J1 [Rhizobium]NNU68199.1 ADP-ribosylation/crystallin J1 [Rhizobium sp. WYCCWR 11152]QKK31740.1 ADP-ribosylation/crystallin J1 [Rhizobium indicum]